VPYVSLSHDPNCNGVAAAGAYVMVRLWDPGTGSALRTLEGHSGLVWALAADRNGTWLAAAGDAGSPFVAGGLGGVRIGRDRTTGISASSDGSCF